MFRKYFTICLLQLFVISYAHGVINCELANDLLHQVDKLQSTDASTQEQKQLLQQAIHICPSNPYAYNKLANLFGTEGNFSLAAHYFQNALNINPSMPEALFGLGEAYYDLHQLPLSLKAYTQLCPSNFSSQKNRDYVFQKIPQLLNNEHYRIPQKDEIFNANSLILLYKEHEALREQVVNCDLSPFPIAIATVSFRNIFYDFRADTLTLNSRRQLAALAETIAVLKPISVHIYSYYPQNKAPAHAKTELEKYNLPGNPTIQIESIKLRRLLLGPNMQRIDIKLVW